MFFSMTLSVLSIYPNLFTALIISHVNNNVNHFVQIIYRLC
nr:MAG TPA: hypothetical protein [Caudoviricetes sp.]